MRRERGIQNTLRQSEFVGSPSPPPRTHLSSLPASSSALAAANLPGPLLIYLERALERRGQDEWHFNVLLRCLVTSTIDHGTSLCTTLPPFHFLTVPRTPALPRGRGLAVRQGMSFHVGLD